MSEFLYLVEQKNLRSAFSERRVVGPIRKQRVRALRRMCVEVREGVPRLVNVREQEAHRIKPVA